MQYFALCVCFLLIKFYGDPKRVSLLNVERDRVRREQQKKHEEETRLRALEKKAKQKVNDKKLMSLESKKGDTGVSPLNPSAHSTSRYTPSGQMRAQARRGG